MAKVTISEFFFFSYMLETFIKGNQQQQKTFKNFIPYSFYVHVKLSLTATRFSKYVLEANFETIFWEKP